ncbi:MAG: GNAT family N-acetyltransferase [Halovenus sp.]
MEIVTPETDIADDLADQWVSFAARQREYGSHILADENRTQIRESITRHIVGDRLLVAREQELLGFVMFGLESGTYEQSLTRGVVENLYVVPERRSEGIGSTLLEAAEDRLRERGVDAITLEVMTANESARSFYRDHGYTPHRLECEKRVDGPATPRRVENDNHSKDDG